MFSETLDLDLKSELELRAGRAARWLEVDFLMLTSTMCPNMLNDANVNAGESDDSFVRICMSSSEFAGPDAVEVA